MPTIAFVLFTLSGFIIYRMNIRSAVPAEAQGAFVAIPDTSTGVVVNLSPEVEWVMDEDSGYLTITTHLKTTPTSINSVFFKLGKCVIFNSLKNS